MKWCYFLIPAILFCLCLHRNIQCLNHGVNYYYIKVKFENQMNFIFVLKGEEKPACDKGTKNKLLFCCIGWLYPRKTVVNTSWNYKGYQLGQPCWITTRKNLLISRRCSRGLGPDVAIPKLYYCDMNTIIIANLIYQQKFVTQELHNSN